MEGDAAEFVRKGIPAGTEKTTSPKEKTLIPKGYRVWTGVNGNTVFAKLSRYSEKTQTLWLQEMDGHQSRTSLKRLSLEDRTWLLEQKESHENNGRNKRSGPRGA